MHTYDSEMTYPPPFCQGLKALISPVRSPSESYVWVKGGIYWFGEGGELTGAEEVREDGSWWWLGTKGNQRGP
jgi:hypothetical protein